MDTIVSGTLARFSTNLDSVYALMEFDRFIVQFALAKFEAMKERLEEIELHYQSLQSTTDNAIVMLRNIHDNDSLRTEYQNMHNQGVVLLVSYFTAAVREVFEHSLNTRLAILPSNELPKDEFKLTLQELRQLRPTDLARLISDNNDYSFQDMKSIARAFRTYLLFDPVRDKHVSNIIAAQACRHAIVHRGVVADEQCIRQLAHAKDREVKQRLAAGDAIAFTLPELRTVGQSMRSYLEAVAVGAWQQIPTEGAT